VHPDPSKALSDAGSQLELKKFPEVVSRLLEVYAVASKEAHT
jgi:3-deoxy-D-manno-octulosonic acid (KDO) 8-phosphate synthase